MDNRTTFPEAAFPTAKRRLAPTTSPSSLCCGESVALSSEDVDIVVMVQHHEISLNSCQKVFVERDFRDGIGIRFKTDLPDGIRGLITESAYTSTIDNINTLFAEVEEVGTQSAAETFVSCATCYLNRFFAQSRYEKQLARIQAYIAEQNRLTFIPAGIVMTDPMQRGMRVLELSLLATGGPPAPSTTRPDRRIEEV
uniref:Ras modification protein ERF4 n=1 Tax=Panagrellus redivivus TaxID=6233 RepID=A0A7E4VEQ5_PANRE